MDARAFQGHLEQRRLRSAVALYSGPFLPDDPGPELACTRERLRSQFARAVGELALRAAESGQLPEALDHLRRGLEVDPRCEALQVHLHRLSRQPT
ncbi:MAG: bacterial transcriptional activator domain-containing protein [Candidatus Eremiobacterota bacterium]